MVVTLLASVSFLYQRLVMTLLHIDSSILIVVLGAPMYNFSLSSQLKACLTGLLCSARPSATPRPEPWGWLAESGSSSLPGAVAEIKKLTAYNIN